MINHHCDPAKIKSQNKIEHKIKQLNYAAYFYIHAKHTDLQVLFDKIHKIKNTLEMIKKFVILKKGNRD